MDYRRQVLLVLKDLEDNGFPVDWDAARVLVNGEWLVLRVALYTLLGFTE